MAISLVLVDDHVLFREALRLMIATQPDFHVVGEASGAPDAYRIVDQTKPDVLILDILLQQAGGLSIARKVLRTHPGQRILALSMFADEDHVAGALAAGVIGYATKDLSAEELFSAIRKVAAGEAYLAPGISRSIEARPRDHQRAPGLLRRLTSREREIFDLVIRGLSNQEIAAQLSISIRTIETHRGRIMRKLNVHSATDLVRLAARLGLLNA